MSQAIDQYISDQREDIQPILHQVRETLRAALPEAEERISWRMPTYWKDKNIIHFAAFNNHMGIYPGDVAIEHFRDRLSDYHFSKGAIRFPYDRPIPPGPDPGHRSLVLRNGVSSRKQVNNRKGGRIHDK